MNSMVTDQCPSMVAGTKALLDSTTDAKTANRPPHPLTPVPPIGDDPEWCQGCVSIPNGDLHPTVMHTRGSGSFQTFDGRLELELTTTSDPEDVGPDGEPCPAVLVYAVCPGRTGDDLVFAIEHAATLVVRMTALIDLAASERRRVA
ncbi:MAG: hypothetical protein ACRDQH_07990 [Pseudonocardiaceae bacterium]